MGTDKNIKLHIVTDIKNNQQIKNYQRHMVIVIQGKCFIESPGVAGVSTSQMYGLIVYTALQQVCTYWITKILP